MGLSAADGRVKKRMNLMMISSPRGSRGLCIIAERSWKSHSTQIGGGAGACACRERMDVDIVETIVRWRLTVDI